MTNPRTSRPQSEDGKRSAMSEIRQAFTTSNLLIKNDQERELAELIERGLRTELTPKGCFEELIFAQLLHATWNLHRIRQMEADLYAGNPHPILGSDPIKAMDRLVRYQRATERLRRQSAKELRDQQTQRMTTERIGHTLQTGEDEVLPATADTAKVQLAVIRAEKYLSGQNRSAASPLPTGFYENILRLTDPPQMAMSHKP